MTRKHYIEFASMFHRAFSDNHAHSTGVSFQVVELFEDFVDYLAAENSNFDRARFIKAATEGTEVEEHYADLWSEND